MRNASGHQLKVKVSGSKNKVNNKTYDFSSIKRVTKKFLEVSRCSRAKQRQRNVQKKCAARTKLLFFYIQLFRERLSEKVHATIPKGTVGGFVCPVFQRKLKEWHERPRTYVREC